MNLPKRYHPVLVTMHWLIALLVFINLYLGVVAFENRGGDPGAGPGGFQTMNPLLGVHMVVGVTLIVLMIIRVIVRVKTANPLEATAGNKFLDSLAKLVHYGLYIVVLAVTVIGLIFSFQTGRFQSTFLGAESQFGPPNSFPAIEGTPGPGQFVPLGDGTSGFPEGGPPPGFQGGPGGPSGMFGLLVIHEVTAYVLLALVVLHILAALYHQFIRKDNLLSRMWYGKT